MTNLSSSLLLPLLKLSIPVLRKNNIVGYIGRNQEWGKEIILTVPVSVDFALLQALKSHAWFKEHYVVTSNLSIFVFDIPEDVQKTIIDPFLKGQYSKIDREYVNTYFQERIQDEKTGEVVDSINYGILTKSDSLRHRWEQRLGTYVPEEVELYDKPSKKKEIYGFNDRAITVAPNTVVHLP